MSERGSLPTSLPRKAPGPVLASFWILVVSAALHIASSALTVATWHTLVQQGLGQRPKGISAIQWSQEIHDYLVTTLVLDIAFAVIYVALAYAIRSGRNWARVTLTVIIVLSGVFILLQGGNISTLVLLLVALVAVVLLYLPASRAFFAPEPTAPRQV